LPLAAGPWDLFLSLEGAEAEVKYEYENGIDLTYGKWYNISTVH
jgi:hypothetical protein